MAYILDRKADKKCRCGVTVVFTLDDLRHYHHDVDGNNVYVVCPSCGTDIDVYKESADKGWVERDPL